MAFKLRSGNRPTFKMMGSSTPFTKVDVGDIKPDLGSLKDKISGGGGGGLKDKLTSKGGGGKGPKINLPKSGKGGGGGKTTTTKLTGKTKTTKTKTTTTKPKVDKKPKVDTKPKVDKKPKVDTKPKVDAKPKQDTKPKADVKPKVDAKPKTSKEDTFAKDTKGMTPEQQAEAYTSMIQNKAEAQPKAAAQPSAVDKRAQQERRLDNLQTGMGAVGLTPAYGNVADLTNVGISGARAARAWWEGDKDSMRKHFKNMGVSAVSAIPGTQVVGAGALASDLANRSKTGGGNRLIGSKENTWQPETDRSSWSPGGSTTT